MTGSPILMEKQHRAAEIDAHGLTIDRRRREATPIERRLHGALEGVVVRDQRMGGLNDPVLGDVAVELDRAVELRRVRRPSDNAGNA